MKKSVSLFLALVMLCALIPSAAASTIYKAEEIKVKHDFQIEGVDDGRGTATYVEVEGGYYISPWKYEVESVSLTVTYFGTDYKVKTRDLDLAGLSEVKISVFEQGGKVIVSTESAPDDAEKIAKFKIDLVNWTIVAMPKTNGLEMAVKYQYKDVKLEDSSNVDAFPLDSAAQEQVEAPAGSVQLIQDFKDCKGTTAETKEIRTMLTPDADGVYFASRWDYRMATKEGDGGVGPNIDCKVVYNGANKKMKGEDIIPDANNCGTMYFFDLNGKLDVDAEVPQGAVVLAECTMSLDGAIWFTPKSDKITTELEFNYDAEETYDEKKNVPQVDSRKPEVARQPEVFSDNPFADVAEGKDYYQPVLWAAARKITLGKTEATFVPADACTRAQMITFLWRAAGSPEPASGKNPYTDVAAERYYYKAALWANEKGLSSGKTFSPDTPCTRAMAVELMWKAAGSPAAKGNAFSDVAAGAAYASAANWAAEQKIVEGGLFGPDGICTRGQAVTLLYRAMHLYHVM